MGNSLLKHGMVVYVGKDPRDGGYIVYRYDETRGEEGRCICFHDSVETFVKLGFEIGPHWNEGHAAKGYLGVKEVSIEFRTNKSNLPDVDPVVKKLKKQKLNNQAFAYLLSREV